MPVEAHHSPRGPAPVRTGVWLYPGQRAGELVDAVVVADELGLDEVWIADEGVAREPSVLLAAAARETRRITLAVGITSPVLRHPGAIASTLATLDELSEGRALLGLGVGGHESLAPFGLTAERPVALVRDAIGIARAVLERTATSGYEPPPHAMPARRVPIWVGARGPQLVRMAARLADGVFLSGCTPEQHDHIVGEFRRGRPAGPTVTAGGIAVYQSVSELSSGPSISAWDDAADDLAAERDRLAPTSIGLNLIDLARPERVDPVALVRRAAVVLDALRP